MNDILLASDKIYSVLTIILMVFFALIAYLIKTDLKLHKMEAQLKNMQKEGASTHSNPKQEK